MFIKKLTKQNEDYPEVEGIINFNSDTELKMILVDDIDNIYRNVYNSNEHRISKK